MSEVLKFLLLPCYEELTRDHSYKDVIEELLNYFLEDELRNITNNLYIIILVGNSIKDVEKVVEDFIKRKNLAILEYLNKIRMEKIETRRLSDFLTSLIYQLTGKCQGNLERFQEEIIEGKGVNMTDKRRIFLYQHLIVERLRETVDRALRKYVEKLREVLGNEEVMQEREETLGDIGAVAGRLRVIDLFLLSDFSELVDLLTRLDDTCKRVHIELTGIQALLSKGIRTSYRSYKNFFEGSLLNNAEIIKICEGLIDLYNFSAEDVYEG
ncbi:MAG: hypothetical protein J7L07_05730, partial [Candidatus Odinarchaeota archaeon]|nr:hypothetical protein [Candidatus Odinarchaeota archaeon]